MTNQKTTNDKKKKFYNCFSTRQFRYLVSCELDPVAINYHSVTKVRFYVFVNDEKLSVALTNYLR